MIWSAALKLLVEWLIDIFNNLRPRQEYNTVLIKFDDDSDKWKMELNDIFWISTYDYLNKNNNMTTDQKPFKERDYNI